LRQLCLHSLSVKSFIAAIIDKTVERQALQEVESVNAKLRAAHDLSLNGFVVIRAIRNQADEIIDFAYIYANAKAEEIGQTKLVGHTLLELFPGNKDSGLYDAYVQVVATDAPFHLKTSVIAKMQRHIKSYYSMNSNIA